MLLTLFVLGGIITVITGIAEASAAVRDWLPVGLVALSVVGMFAGLAVAGVWLDKSKRRMSTAIRKISFYEGATRIWGFTHQGALVLARRWGINAELDRYPPSFFTALQERMHSGDQPDGPAKWSDRR